ncbi:uncharacterized protein LOC129315362 isoform X3 [Prosopis cineraria]|uniref:uncharacterized protein LOC129315362 isoform X3 n=1 Tax=Prosopis cineraria TaxID=364024 RepID=UPI00240F65DF|nr:uncharacterized protein LOC129315362 isoform X3 [Prosopis cineraria]
MKQLCETEHIRFTDPYERLDSTSGDQDYRITEIKDDGEGINSRYMDSDEQFGTRINQKELALGKKRMLMGDDNIASSSATCRCKKRKKLLNQS